MNELARVAHLAAELGAKGVDRLLVSTPVNVRYLSGYTGTNGLLLIAANEDAAHRFYTDFRYASQSAQQVAPEFGREIAPGELVEAAVRALGEGGVVGQKRLGFDDASLTVKQHARLRELLAPGWELVPCAGIVERLREVKDERELAHIRAAAELADEALTNVLEAGLIGRSEREVA
ncbi:MAG TPA: aminopeptidase P family N-terminal domain-containing protein, partial [Solirubrobacteraceae bacterium]|nr:aminopeptidase P family N-terminal domain-containing protein [Solirubrobacteraceae bacterium]